MNRRFNFVRYIPEKSKMARSREVRLSDAEIKTIRMACNVAIDSEEELIAAYTHPFEDRPIIGGRSVWRKSKAFIRRMNAIKVKLSEMEKS